MEEDKRAAIDYNGYLADNEFSSNPLFRELISKRKFATSTKSLSWIGEFCFQRGNLTLTT